MAALDLLGRRWALRVLWELSQADTPLTFRALQERCADVSSSVLATRIRELRSAGIVARSTGGYELSDLGRLLLERLAPLQAWADDWAAAQRRP
jgi:DNA-binding HxlR family transcriptional regulator